MFPKEGPGYTTDAKNRKFCFGIDVGYNISYWRRGKASVRNENKYLKSFREFCTYKSVCF